MESIILWSIGIFIYLLIGWGVAMEAEKYDERGEYEKHEFFLVAITWPVELGCFIAGASLYYKNDKNKLYGVFINHKPFKEAIFTQVYEMNMKLFDIEKSLKTIESITQKDNDKKV